MRIISWNVNGFRAVVRKGFRGWLRKSQADIICLQEIKTQEIEIFSSLFSPKNYHVFINPAGKRGYSGVAVFSLTEPVCVKKVLGLEKFDSEGRILELRFPDFSLLNLYLPHGGRDKSKLDYKLECYRFLLESLGKRKEEKIILAGDFNVAHTDLDLARPNDNRDNIMFTPIERRQLDSLIAMGFIDSFREFHGENGAYSWWPYRLNARKRNLGWRLDYIFLSRSLSIRLKDAFILADISGSDHCPVGIEISSCSD